MSFKKVYQNDNKRIWLTKYERRKSLKLLKLYTKKR